jgi:voltage-gated potassium channel
VITPLRALFLIVLVGTTLELLTERSRQSFRIKRWRLRTRNHTVVVGYGTTGRAAVEALHDDGAEPGDIAIVDPDPTRLDAASAAGLVTVAGDATRSGTLRSANVPAAAGVLHRIDDGIVDPLTAGDRLLYIRKASTDGNRSSTTC